ncbi:MAG: SDR family NAD(P)-dependent oxidoreductase [Glaciimonas sp.]|nr:SDR family NAD(P)-dependent oxidoreductase [Glaciimonas sp.]
MNPVITNWQQQRVWIIGASSGIGAETARQLLAKGARVALSARNTTKLHAIAASHRNALPLVLDITEHATLIAARDHILDAWEGIDLILSLPKAMAYGATKAALINLSECLYLDLRPRGIGVYLINPGFVDTPLTANNDFPMPALMSPENATYKLIEGIERGQFHIHFPKRFTNWLRLARLLPYRLYFTLIHKVTRL